MSKGNGHKTETPDVSHIRNEEVSHETSDINVNAVLSFVLILLVSTIAVYIGMRFLFKYFQTQEQVSSAYRGPMALTKDERLPPEPRLQAAPGFELTLENGNRVPLELKAPEAEYKTLAEQWDKALHGQLTDAAGNTTMPIDQAMKKVVADGLPVRPPSGANQVYEDAVHIPTAFSSGHRSEKVR